MWATFFAGINIKYQYELETLGDLRLPFVMLPANHRLHSMEPLSLTKDRNPIPQRNCP